METVIQNILIKPTADDALYDRKSGKIAETINALVFFEGASFSTDTYFNALSIGKWKKYCHIHKVFLNILFQGAFSLQVIHSCLSKNDGIIENIILEEKLCSDSRVWKKIELPDCRDGVIYFKLLSLVKESCFFCASYTADTEEEKKVRIALNICTYKREKYLLHNLTVLRESFLNNKNSYLYGQIEVFITDNGNTLDIASLQEQGVHITYNRNLGGTGGFARGLLEIMKVKEKAGITHVIFMDDDVEIEPESLVRTYVMLKLLKEKYRNAFIAGAMLRLDQNYIQHENGAVWNNGKCKFVGRGLDLRNFQNVVRNETHFERDYAAWWYCCVPAAIITKDNLPIPVFIHEDDVEYSLRNTNHIITMNGIAIWHESSEHRRISANEYYNLRNMLIVNALHGKYSAAQVKKQVLTALLVAFFRYRYRDMVLIKQAIEDFCKGPRWLMKTDAEKYHQRIQERGYSFQDIRMFLSDEETKVHYEENSGDGWKRRIKNARSAREIGRLIIQVITLNGYFLPADTRVQAYYMNVHPVRLYRTGKLVLFDEKDDKGIITKRSGKQLFVMLRFYCEASLLISKKYRDSCQEFRRLFPVLRSSECWESMLGCRKRGI